MCTFYVFFDKSNLIQSIIYHKPQLADSITYYAFLGQVPCSTLRVTSLCRAAPKMAVVLALLCHCGLSQSDRCSLALADGTGKCC